MSLIPKFEEFEKSMPLEGKITPELAEKLAEYFSEGEVVNEENFIDSIKNTLSKTFLGSLSYISMIDKLRTEVLKLEKELVSKKYQHEEEMESLKNSADELTKSDNQTAVVQAKKNIANKLNEYQIYKKLMDSKIQKALDVVSGIIKGNKRRTEYWEAGKAKDEVELLEFEYALAKKKSSSNSEELKKIEEEIRKAKEDSKKAEEDLKNSKKGEADKKQREEADGVATLDSPTPDYNKAMRSKEGRIKLMKLIKDKINDLEEKVEYAKGHNKGAIERRIKGYKEELEVIKEIHSNSSSGKVSTKQEDFTKKINTLGRNLYSLDAEAKNVTSTSSIGPKKPSSKTEKSKNNKKGSSKSPEKLETSWSGGGSSGKL